MSNAPLSMCYGKSQLTALLTKHINMNKNMHDKIAHQQLKTPLLMVEDITKCTKEHSNKNIGSGSQNALTVNETQFKTK